LGNRHGRDRPLPAAEVPLQTLFECSAQKAIAGYAADQQYGFRMQAGFSFLCLPHKRINNSPLIACHEIQRNLRNLPAGAARLDSAQLYVAQRCGFEPAETEIEAAVADFGIEKEKRRGFPF